MRKLFDLFLWWIQINFYIIRIVIHPSAGTSAGEDDLAWISRYVEEHTFLFVYFSKGSYLCIRKSKEVITIKNNAVMNAEQILDFIRTMAMSQGFYGRLLADIQEDSSILDLLVNQHFGDPMDLIFFLEC